MDFIQDSMKRYPTISFDLCFFLDLDPEAQKLVPPAVAYKDHGILNKKLFSTLGTLQPLETSARLSQETRTES